MFTFRKTQKRLDKFNDYSEELRTDKVSKKIFDYESRVFDEALKDAVKWRKYRREELGKARKLQERLEGLASVDD